jgi:heme oxygenase
LELRARTASAHEALDRQVGALLTRETYHFYLTGIAAFRLAVEPQLERIPASLGGWKPGRTGQAIVADLNDLGLPTRQPARLDLPLASESSVYGALYVLEGSALGARLLYRQAQALGFSATFGARHLAEQTASIDGWRTFLALLEAAEPFDMAEAAAGADATFHAARNAFESLSGVRAA